MLVFYAYVKSYAIFAGAFVRGYSRPMSPNENDETLKTGTLSTPGVLKYCFDHEVYFRAAIMIDVT